MKIVLTNENLNILKKVSNDYKIPVTKLANLAIADSLDIFLKKYYPNMVKEKPLLDNYNASAKNETVIKLKISEIEKNHLFDALKYSGSSSITAEIRLRILNSIYQDRFLNTNEIKELSKIQYELNAIGRNIHQILVYLYRNKQLQADELKKEIDALLEILDKERKVLDRYMKRR